MNVGFIGLGIMGAPMASNLIQAGHSLTVYDRVAARCEALAARGARQAATPAGAAAGNDAVITMVPDTPDVEAALFGEEGAAEGLRPGAALIDMSTIAPGASMEFAARLAARGVDMLDAPVSGGEPGARLARLSIMVGGKREVFERFRCLLDVMGNNVIYAGPNGNGLKVKLVNQVAGTLSLLATVEAMRIARAAGLDERATVSAVAGGAAGSWMMSNLGPKIIEGDFAPGFSIRLHQKDLRLTMEWIRQLGLEAPGAALGYELFTKALEKGLGEQGNQGLFNLWT
ncbi:MAG: NAD(P)-dependent oxidoreductase [Bryobacterales bacterium]|nr:NAD(P)-dependent oxidoreductase [Bryobacterales bacterium]